MAVTNNQVVHAAGIFTGVPAVFTPIRADGCTLTNPGAGQYRVVTPAGFLSSGENLKITVNVQNAAAPRVYNVNIVGPVTVDLLTFDLAGAAKDCDAIWISIEIVPRVS